MEIAVSKITNAGRLTTFLRLGVNGGYRFTQGPFGFNLLGKLAFEDWLRTIKDGVSTTNSTTAGNKEKSIFSVRAWLAASIVVSPVCVSG